MRKINRLVSVIISLSLIISTFGLLIDMSKASVNAATTYQGLGVTKHTKAEVISYINNHPWTSEAVKYDAEPSASSPYALGKVSDDSLQSALNYLNILRYITGVSEVTLSDDSQEYAQAAALINAANNSLSHYPTAPSDMDSTLAKKGATGAGNSNLGTGNNLVNLLNRYMTEANGDKENFGHRRQLLDPGMTTTGFGVVTNSKDKSYSATYVDAYMKENIVVSYPAQYQPLEYFGNEYAWTVIIPSKVTAANVVVKVTDNATGKVWLFDQNKDGNDYLNISTWNTSSSCLIFAPSDILYRDGDVYTVEITGISTPIKYEVNMFNVNKIPVESVKINNYCSSGIVGKIQTSCCNTTFTPTNASNKIISWTSSDPSIARVSNYGASNCQIACLNVGTVTITGVTEDGGKTISFPFEVKPKPESIECVDSITIGVGQDYTLSAKVLPTGTIPGVIFTSQDSTIAKIPSTIYGSQTTITGVKKGTTTVTAYASALDSVKKVITVNVVDPVYISGMSILGEDTVNMGDVISYDLSILPSNATCTQVSWSSSNINVLKSSGNGIFTASGLGTCTITAKALDGSGITATKEVKVYQKLATPSAPTLSCKTNTSITLSSYNSNAVYSMDGKTWQSSSTFSDLSPNTEYTFYVKLNSNGYYLESDVSEAAHLKTTYNITSLSITNTETYVYVGDKLQFAATYLPGDADNTNITWSVSNTAIATIDEKTGVLTGVSYGYTYVYAQTSTGVKSSYRINVYDKQEAPETLTLNNSTSTWIKVNPIVVDGKTVQYSIDGKTWNTSGEFFNLSPNTEYKVYARYVAYSTYYYSEASKPLVVKTPDVAKPTATPTTKPTATPTTKPTATPTTKPTATPTAVPTVSPTATPTPVDCSVGSVTLTATSYTYNGKVHKPGVVAKDLNGNIIPSTNYNVYYSSGCTNVGTYTVNVVFNGNYSGTWQLTYIIKPAKTSIKTLSSRSKGFYVKWSKVSKQISGYQIQYSTSSNFSSGTKTVNASWKSVSKTISKLKKKKYYYVRIRVYKTVNGVRYYSDWSSAKKIKTR